MAINITPIFSLRKSPEFTTKTAKITDDDGSLIFEKNLRVPETWSHTATAIYGNKYARETETNVSDTVKRMISCWKKYALELGYFTTETIDTFTNEIHAILINQIASPNSPQWFNTGIFETYHKNGNTNETYYYFNPTTNTVNSTKHNLEKSQPHACFILPIEDNLFNSNGIFEHIRKEAHIFKKGSGSGSNYSNIRGLNEPLSSGGTSSGLLSFLKLFDTAADAIKSGGISRRAAKMIVLDDNHPDLIEFIEWKSKEEKKAQALINAGYSSNYEGEAYKTISGQNANNSIRISHEFMIALNNNTSWALQYKTSNKIKETLPASQIWNSIIKSSWECAEPGIQFSRTINDWHTCLNDGEIVASNPCSEYFFLDNTACNLASINLLKFYNPTTNEFDINAFKHTVRLITILLDISIDIAQFPTPELAEKTYKYRTLGLGYTNLGALLMCMGIAYDSDLGRNTAAAITSLMTATAYDTSVDLAKELGTFKYYNQNSKQLLKVLTNHKNATFDVSKSDYIDLTIIPQGIKPLSELIIAINTEAKNCWTHLIEKVKLYGVRNAQVTAIAPTGTISMLMDCDTTGIEPDFSLIKFKKLSGGGLIQIVNQNVATALHNLKYTKDEIISILEHIEKTHTIENSILKPEHLPIFDCANKNGPNGKRYINYTGHIKMLASVQPFVSGGISKTINFPSDATIEDVNNCYIESYYLGIKSLSIYRDQCKQSQPLNTNPDTIVNPTNTNDLILPYVKKLPIKRKGFTYKLTIQGQTLFLKTGEYEDGSLGEIFIDMHKEGATLRSLLNCFAISISIGLQHGVPLQEFVDKFSFTRFEPAGITNNPTIKTATSILDAIFRLLASEYLNDTTIVHNQPEIPLNQTKQDYSLGQQGDSPLCPSCGFITVRSGTCYYCLNCGLSLGCS
jgi:ribonucleoside-diphosphate reductase alpha chain